LPEIYLVNRFHKLRKIAALLLIGLWIAFVAVDPLDGLLSPVDGIAVRAMSSASAGLFPNTHAIVDDDGQPPASPSVIAVLNPKSHASRTRHCYRGDTDCSILRAQFPLYKFHVHFLI
jgi:hypothetical protein